MTRDADPPDDASRAALEAMLLRHLPAIRAYLRLNAGAAVRAEEWSGDLAQSVCREALEHGDAPRFDDDAAFRRWLFTIAFHKVVDRARRAAVRRAAHGRPVDDASDAALGEFYASRLSPSGEVAGRESIERLERAFDALPDEQREVLVLAKIAGLSQAEIGAQIGKSEEAVRKILSRSLARISTLAR